MMFLLRNNNLIQGQAKPIQQDFKQILNLITSLEAKQRNLEIFVANGTICLLCNVVHKSLCVLIELKQI